MTKLTDAQWHLLQPHMPPETRLGRNRGHDREVLNSLLYRLKTGCRYRDIPRTPEYAAPSTTFYWFKRWTERGLLKRIWQALLGLLDSIGEIDLRKGSMDGSFVPGKRGGEWVDLGRKGNGSTLMVVSEAHGFPVAFLLAQASTHESQLARETLAEVRVSRLGRGRPKTRILEIAMDRAFDAQELRRDLRKRGIRASIPERKRRGKRRQRGPRPKQYPVAKERYKVERVNAWMDTYRALVVRYERTASHYLGYCVLSGIVMCLKRLLASPQS